MMQPSTPRCPDEETLAAWVEGRLAPAEAAALTEHASSCAHCVALIDAANEALHEESPRAVSESGSRWWLLAAAAVLLIALPIALLVRSRTRDPLQQLVAEAPRSARPVEARLSGGFAWAPYHGSMRADGAPLDNEQMKLMGKAAEILSRAERDPSPETQRAGAMAMVLIGRAEESIPRLAAEARRSPTAQAWNDLAAAQYAAALAGRASFYPEALASADRALHIDPRFAEALFNRALIVERLGLRGEARAAWQRYLDRDASSPWAEEARQHLARLAAAHDGPSFDADREHLETAAAAGDEPAVRALVGRHAERARAWAEAEYLGRWADAVQQNDPAGAERWLAVARSIGAALARTSGEALLRDAVQAIDAADPPRRRQIADAHAAYRRGRIAFSRKDAAGAERDLRLAAEQFAAAADPMALAARSYAAGARLAQNDVAQSRRELAALLVEVDAVPGYVSLGGQVRWELARSLIFDGDASAAARLLAEAESAFRRAGESVNQATVGSMLAESLIADGRPDEAWNAQIRALETLAAAGRVELLDGAIGGAATIALRTGKLETARALVSINESLERGMANDFLLADTLVRKSLLELPLDTAAAQRAAGEAVSVAMRIPDNALRTRHLADADLAMAAALLDPEPRRAQSLASQALELYGSTGMVVLQAEPYLVRARAALRLRDTAAAERDLDAGIAAVEQHPARAGGAVIGTGVLDAGNALFEEAIRIDLDRRDIAAAFAHAERRRGFAAGAGELEQVRARLAGSGNAIVELIALPGEIITMTIAEGGISMARRAMPREALIALAARDDDAAAAALYDALLRPAAPALAAARALIVVPDELLERVPFAALRDGATNRLLIERMPVAMAPSATELRAAPARRAPASVATIELPSGRGTALLPEAELELAEIGKLYPAVRRAGGDEVTPQAIGEAAAAADVLHIAGHTESDPVSGGEALAAGGGAVSWRAIAALHDLSPVVVLSACNTLRRPPDADRRALSLAGAFVAAGARDVIGTLAPIGDADARTLFFALHQQLIRGIAPPAALRNVQLGQQQRPGRAWRHLALLTTTIHRID